MRSNQQGSTTHLFELLESLFEEIPPSDQPRDQLCRYCGKIIENADKKGINDRDLGGPYCNGYCLAEARLDVALGELDAPDEHYQKRIDEGSN